MLVTVTFSAAAFFWTAVHSWSDTRIVRVGVLGELGMPISVRAPNNKYWVYWLPPMDSNHNSRVQSAMSFR